MADRRSPMLRSVPLQEMRYIRLGRLGQRGKCKKLMVGAPGGRRFRLYLCARPAYDRSSHSASHMPMRRFN